MVKRHQTDTLEQKAKRKAAERKARANEQETNTIKRHQKDTAERKGK